MIIINDISFIHNNVIGEAVICQANFRIYPFSRTHFTLPTSFKMFTFQHVVSFGSFFSVQNFKTD